MPRTHPDPGSRTRRDLCPGVLRPWPAADGSLVRIRIVGGEVEAATLAALSELAATYGDGDLHLTSRANLQMRGVDHGEAFVQEVEAMGLLPSRQHDQARNIMVSPLTGRVGGRVDVRPVAVELDELIRYDERAADLPGRFLFTLDDGRGDLADRPTDLGLMALDDRSAQLRVADGWGPVVTVARAAAVLFALAHRFLGVRGDGPDAAWHVAELPPDLLSEVLTPHPADARTVAPPDRPGPALGAAHLAVPDGVLTPDLVRAATKPGGPLVVTPWNSIIVTELLP